MKTIKSLMCALAFVLSVFAVSAQTGSDDLKNVYLNSGRIVTGTVTMGSDNAKVTVVTPQGDTYIYTTAEVAKIEPASKKPAAPGTGNAPAEGYYTNVTENGSGFWFAVESVTGYSCRIDHPNAGFEELDAVAGYRFNQHLMVGVGAGARYYWNNDHLRDNSSAWAAPLFLNVRGSIIPRAYRRVVPFYSLDCGATFRDGFMVRPALGLRIGELRNAFTIALAYNGQSTRVVAGDITGQRRFVSFVALKLGYEF